LNGGNQFVLIRTANFSPFCPPIFLIRGPQEPTIFGGDMFAFSSRFIATTPNSMEFVSPPLFFHGGINRSVSGVLSVIGESDGFLKHCFPNLPVNTMIASHPDGSLRHGAVAAICGMIRDF